MLISFKWSGGHKSAGIVVDRDTLLCTSAAPIIGHLKGATMAQVLKWAMACDCEVYIKHTKPE